nr:MAG TPA: hypothetical protein [Caudoviricetes sp.]
MKLLTMTQCFSKCLIRHKALNIRSKYAILKQVI